MSKPDSGSLTAEAYNRLRAEILACRLRPGQKLVIADLCSEFSFSLGAIRESLARLSAEGLVTAEPRKGFTVAPITEGELRDITTVRTIVECLCLESAITHGDLTWESGIVAALFELSRTPLADSPESASVNENWASTHKKFHEALVAACDSPWLLKLRDILFAQSERYRRFSVPLDLTGRDLQSEHKEIADAVIGRDRVKAVDAMKSHLEKTSQILIASGVVDAPRVSSGVKGH